MTQKGDVKFKEKLTRGLKYDIRNLVNFHLSSRKSENNASLTATDTKWSHNTHLLKLLFDHEVT